METDRIIKVLTKTSRFFHSLNDDEMREILKRCRSRSFGDGTVIFQENTRGDELFIIVSGSVRVKKEGRIIDVVRAGECFGEMGALTGEERSASAEANGDVVLLVIADSSIGTLKPDITVKLFRNILLVLSDRMRKRLEEKAHQSQG